MFVPHATFVVPHYPVSDLFVPHATFVVPHYLVRSKTPTCVWQWTHNVVLDCSIVSWLGSVGNYCCCPICILLKGRIKEQYKKPTWEKPRPPELCILCHQTCPFTVRNHLLVPVVIETTCGVYCMLTNQWPMTAHGLLSLPGLVARLSELERRVRLAAPNIYKLVHKSWQIRPHVYAARWYSVLFRREYQVNKLALFVCSVDARQVKHGRVDLRCTSCSHAVMRSCFQPFRPARCAACRACDNIGFMASGRRWFVHQS